MLVDYAVTEMGFFDDYWGAAPRTKKTRGSNITTFILHISQCITLNEKKFVTATLIDNARFNSFYSR